MVSIGNGAKAQGEAQIASLGENVILIFSGSTTASGIRTGLFLQFGYPGESWEDIQSTIAMVRRTRGDRVLSPGSFSSLSALNFTRSVSMPRYFPFPVSSASP